MTSLQGKYERVPQVDGRKGHGRVPRERNRIQWTPEMDSAFVQLKEALSAECVLYIQSPDGEYRVHVDAWDHGVGAVLEQQEPQGEWNPCAFFSRKLEGKDGKGKRAWSTGEQDTYALVSCLLELKSWIGGRKVTAYTDHKSLESWYKEDLCTLPGPLGRRGRWHEFSSGYHIEVVYKPGKDNTVADGLFWWAYLAGLADDTNFPGSDADQKGVMKKERELKEREETFLAQRARDMQVQSDTGLLNAITAVGAVLTLQWLGYATVQALSAHQAWVQPCPSILQCYHDSPQDIQDRQDKEVNELAASIASLKGCAADWSSDTVSGYAAHLQARMSHLLCWPKSEGLICAVSKVNIPPQSKILYEDWTEYYLDEFPDWDFESDPVISNPNYSDYGMRWDDDEKRFRFKGKIVCPTALFEDVLVAIHSYGHPRVQKTVELVGPPLGTRSPHGGLGLYPGNRPRRPPTRPAATPPGDHPHRPRRRPLGSPPHSTVLGSRLPQQPRHTGTHGGMGHAGQGHEELPPSPPLRRQSGRTAMAIRSPGDHAQARRPHAQPRKCEHGNARRTPTEGSGPASNAPLLQTPRPPSPATSSPTQASKTKKGRTRPQPSRKSSDLPTPRTPPDPPGEPGPSILVILPPIIITAPPGPGILIILPPATSTAPAKGVPGIRKGRKGPAALLQRPHRRLDLV